MAAPIILRKKISTASFQEECKNALNATVANM